MELGLRKEMQRELNRIKPYAIGTLLKIFKQTDKEHLKRQAAYAIISRSEPNEVHDVNKYVNADIKELVITASQVAQDKVKAAEKQVLQAQERRHERREDFALSEDEWEATLKHFEHKCAYCGKQKKITYDHFIPLSKGGSFTQDNLIPACKSCNSSKRDRDFNYWYYKQPYYDQEREQQILSFIDSFD